MTWLILLLLVGIAWELWEVRRALGLRARPALPRRHSLPTARRPDYRGAVPPARFAVVRWPDGHHFYLGCEGAAARRMYEHTHPAVGEEVEFWELGDRRGHKEG